MLNLTYQNDFFDFTSYQNTRQQMYKPLDISEESIYQGPFLEKGNTVFYKNLGHLQPCFSWPKQEQEFLAKHVLFLTQTQCFLCVNLTRA